MTSKATRTLQIQPVARVARRGESAGPTIRQRLLTAALEVLQREPYAAFTQARVAAQAGVRQSHLTYYFATRNDLLRAVVEAARNEAVSQPSPPTRAPSREPGSGLRALRERVCSPSDSPALPRLMVALTAASDEDERLRTWLAAFEADNKARVKAVLASLGLRVQAAPLDVFHATLVGAAFLEFQQRTSAARRRAARTCRMAFDRLVADARSH
jgi:AcrR family transcriptional regulator